MKLFLLLTSLLIVGTQGETFHPGDDDWFLLGNHAGTISDEAKCVDSHFCATVENAETSSGTTVVLDTCTWEPVEGWRTATARDGNAVIFMLGDSNGYTGNKKAMCMQAGHGEPIVGSRATVRLYPCDIDSPLQRFVIKNYNGDCGDKEGGKIKLQSNRDLCLTWHGADDVTPGETNLVVMPCKDVKGARAIGWFFR